MLKFISIFLIVFLLMCYKSGFTQSENHNRNTIDINAGFSLVGALFDIPVSPSGVVNKYSFPAIQFTYDYFMNKWISFGAAASLQFMGLEYDDYTYYDGNTVVNGNVDIKRYNFGARILFHYLNSGNIDLFSGLRGGFTNWDITENYVCSEEYSYEEVLDFKTGINFAPQIILCGLRGYFNSNFGANIELCIGAPCFYSMGVNYRF